MYNIFRSSSCRKNALVSYNSLAIRENYVFLDPFAWQCPCVWLMKTTEKTSTQLYKNVNRVFKIQERVHIVYIHSNVSFYNPLIFIDHLNLAIIVS